MRPHGSPRHRARSSQQVILQQTAAWIHEPEVCMDSDFNPFLSALREQTSHGYSNDKRKTMNVPAAQRSTFKQSRRCSYTGALTFWNDSVCLHSLRPCALQSYPFDFGSMCLMASSTSDVCWLRSQKLSQVSGISGAMKAGVPGLDKRREDSHILRGSLRFSEGGPASR